MNIAIDIGNTRAKYGLYDENQLVKSNHLPLEAFQKEILRLKNKEAFEAGIASSTANLDDELENLFEANNIHVFNHTSPLPISSSYKTPETLGLDRVAAVVAANARFPKNDCLVIDIGTCITYDLITAKKEHLGGAIAPGLQMRYRAMHDFTDKLPLVSSLDYIKDYGQSTNEAMSMGVINGMVHEIQGFIRSFSSKHQKLKIILTGGDATLFERHLENSIFAAQNLVLEGLNEVLLFNKQPNE